MPGQIPRRSGASAANWKVADSCGSRSLGGEPLQLIFADQNLPKIAKAFKPALANQFPHGHRRHAKSLSGCVNIKQERCHRAIAIGFIYFVHTFVVLRLLQNKLHSLLRNFYFGCKVGCNT